MWKKKPRNWPKVNKYPEELPCVNDLTASLLPSSSLGGMPTPFLFGCVFLPCSCLNCFSVCSPTCCGAVSLIINFVPAFTVLVSMRNEFLSGGKSQGKFASNIYCLLIWWLGFLVFIQGIQVQFLVKELRSHFLLLLTAASPRSVRFV